MKTRTHMTHDFSRIPQTNINRSTFDRSHGVKTAFDAGYLVPIYLDEVLPGDTFKTKCELACRMTNPLVSALLDNMFIETQWFYCPSRLLWNNFTKMMGERKNPRDSIDYLVPTINSGENGFAIGSLADYLGCPTGIADLDVSVLPFRMYQKVWDEWYRAEQLQDSVIQTFDDLGDGNPNNIAWNTLRRRGKRHDYFTSALPSSQLGAGVTLPLGDSAPVFGTDKAISLCRFSNGGVPLAVGFAGNDARSLYVGDYSTAQAHSNLPPAQYTSANGTSLSFPTKEMMGSTEELQISRAFLQADLSQATSATINSLRMAFQLQRMAELDSRSGGMRYTEIVRAHFNTICPDARLQRSEYLGGSSCRIDTPTVTSHNKDSSLALGQLASIGMVSDSVKWTKSFTEHGYVLGLVNVRADLSYQQGLNRLWSRRGRYDFYWPALAHLGEQAVLNKEIYCQGPSVVGDDGEAIDDKPFGYQERYAEYRYHPSIITGKLRSTASGTLDIWHLAQKFASLPLLSGTFIEDNPPIARVSSVQGEPQFVLDAYINSKCTRPMPTYSVPGLIDHI